MSKVLDLDKLRDKVRRRRRRGPRPPGPTAEPADATALSDLGNAERLRAGHGDDLRHCPEHGGWLAWDGRRWAPGALAEANRRAQAAVRAIYQELEGAEGDEQVADILRHALRSESRRAVRDMLEHAQHFLRFATAPEAFDTHPYLFNVLNGTLDVRTGELKPHSRDDLITKVAPVEWNPDIDTGEWRSFLRDRLGNEELEQFLARAVGYSLTEDNSHDVLFLIHGEGGSGKSTFLEATRSMMGDYARVADFTSFLRERFPTPGRPRPDLIALAGARLVAGVEVDKGKQLAEGLVKQLTGGDKMTARDVYKGQRDFFPKFKTWLVCNHAPKVNADDTGMWRRIMRIPFDKAIPRASQDSSLRRAWSTDPARRSAILKWAVLGCEALFERGDLAVPACVVEATETLRAEMDPCADFIARELVFRPEGRVHRSTLQARYARACERAGEKPANKKELLRAVRAAGERAGVVVADTSARDAQGKVRDALRGVEVTDAPED